MTDRFDAHRVSAIALTWRTPTAMPNTASIPRSYPMYSMNEALAREHVRRRQSEARRQSLARELASANRWRYLERRAHDAHQRHTRRAARAAALLAVAE